MLTNCLAACTHLSSTIAIFTYRSPHFCFPWRRPFDYHVIFAWMERQFNACQTPRNMYLSIFNSFRVIRCLSQCVSPKIAIFTTFLFPLGTPLGQSRWMLYGWKENSMLTNCLAACAHLTVTVSEIQRDIGRKSSIFSYPLHSTPPLGGSSRNIDTPFGAEKLEWCRYPMVKKFRRYVYSFWRDPRTWQTDRQTDTGWQQRPRLCIASRGKNRRCCLFVRLLVCLFVCLLLLLL